MKPWPLSVLVAALAVCAGVAAEDSISLSGSWQFSLDRQDAGKTQRWFVRELAGKIKLPGSLQEQGFGDDVTAETGWTGDIIDRSWFTAPEYAAYRQAGNVKVPFWLQPAKTWTGPAWYQRSIEIPEAWRQRRVVLSLERPHWETTVWVDDQLIGSCNSLSTPHDYELPATLAPGRHRLTVRVDNRLAVEVGVNSHSVTDHTQGNWNGVAGAIVLRSTPRVWVESLAVYPRVAAKSARVKGLIGNVTGQAGSGRVVLEARDSAGVALPSARAAVEVSWTAAGGQFEAECALGAEARLWDEFHPVLYTVEAVLDGAGSPVRTVFGLREPGVLGTQITVNGRPVFLRGALECAIHPLHGYPPADKGSWARIMQAARAHGLNHLRFHSWCPPEAAFQAADEAGMYLYVECASWANQGSTVGDGRPLDRWLYDEAGRILKAYGNHPSFLMMSYGNEPAGKNQKRWLGDFVKHWKALDSRRLYTSAAGWPLIPENDFHVAPDPRIQAWGEGLRSRINARPPETVTDYREFIRKAGAPVISHEIGQWCAYPNFDEIRKYTGSLKARNFEIFRDRLEARGMGDLGPAFLLASGKLQTLCYKEDIESALRTPGMGGFELLGLQDFSGQGTALVGVLDAFWESKGYVRPQEFRAFCSETVPLARLKKRVFQNGETFAAQVDVAHFGPADLASPRFLWTLDDTAAGRFGGGFSASGALTNAALVPSGGLTALGEIRLPLAGFTEARKLRLMCFLEEYAGRGGARFASKVPGSITVARCANTWDVWVYPAGPAAAAPASVRVVEQLDAPALAALKQGGKVMLLSPPARIKGDALGRVEIGFSSIFWNTAWTRRQAPHTLGILCEPRHPALAGFPTESHSNWQWWELVSRSHPFILNDAPKPFRPLVSAIDDWVTARKLGLVFEARVGGGALLACGIDLATDLETRPAARQLRASLFRYMESAAFHPAAELEPALVQSLVMPATPSP